MPCPQALATVMLLYVARFDVAFLTMHASTVRAPGRCSAARISSARAFLRQRLAAPSSRAARPLFCRARLTSLPHCTIDCLPSAALPPPLRSWTRPPCPPSPSSPWRQSSCWCAALLLHSCAAHLHAGVVSRRLRSAAGQPCTVAQRHSTAPCLFVIPPSASASLPAARAGHAHGPARQAERARAQHGPHAGHRRPHRGQPLLCLHPLGAR